MRTSMLLRKLPSSVALMGERGRYSSFNPKHKLDKHKSLMITSGFKHSLCHCLLLLLLFFFLLVFSFWFFSSTKYLDLNLKTINNCSVSVYVYELPAKFNQGLLQDCKHLNIYTDMCPHVANHGLGQPIHMSNFNQGGSTSWYATHQFIAEMIFHARLQNHPCRTWVPGETTLFYIPFYGGLHASSKFREANLTERDQLAVELVDYVSGQAWWKRKQGRDHFLALGRTAWDFMRTEEGVDFGANSLLNLPGVKNMSVLTVERHPWQGHNQFGIPYPSYLHPLASNEVETWQQKMRGMKRPHLFSFVGAPRRGVEKAAIRDEIIKQCSGSPECYLLKCGGGGSNKCHEASEVLGVMSRSQFCLQAPGDSFTRRSTFDSVLAGCIPVFFSRHTAYSQYGWYLPKEEGEYSVYIPEEDGGKVIAIEEQLKKIPWDRVETMRNTVIGLISKLTYMHPNTTATAPNFKDAVDIALQHLSHFVNSNSSLLAAA